MRYLGFILFLTTFMLDRVEGTVWDSNTYYVKGIPDPVLSLNGTWKIQVQPSGHFWQDFNLSDGWASVQVPGEVMMQGIPIRHDQPFVYSRSFRIPSDFEGHRIKIRFEGVYSYARLWINGHYIRDHHGGFTSWEADITSAVQSSEINYVTLEVTDRSDEISYGSGYAKHQIGGILRDVSLMALPNHCPEDITIVTDLDEQYQHARLIVRGKMNRRSHTGKIQLSLTDESDHEILLGTSTVDLGESLYFEMINDITNPDKWDAEHPNLYRLKISYLENDELIWQRAYPTGFREVEVRVNQLLVNGRPVKLRGANRHDIHPLLGRVSTPEYELKDVMLAKEANLNFIRTSHYPPSENFLALCDEYGLYVEDETAVCFVGSHRTEAYRPGATENDPLFKERYLSQLREMIARHRNHPSVILWSIGNENAFGENFQTSYDWVKANDPSRPVIFSYPGNVPGNTKAYDIISMHYPGIEGNMNQYGIQTKGFGHESMPVLFDEWAHVACYNNFTIREDPNIRDFWGRSLDLMWNRIFEAEGGLGGAIWGMIDETFMLPESLPGFNDWWGRIDANVIPAEYAGHTIGYGEWGIVDTWRRKKPEFWNVKKAYSPVKIMKTTFASFEPGTHLSVPVHNRFDHTNINELTLILTYGNIKNQIPLPSIAPHDSGSLEIAFPEAYPGGPVLLEFLDPWNRLVDIYALTVNRDSVTTQKTEVSGKVGLREEKETLSVICSDTTAIIFNKKTGLMERIAGLRDTLQIHGPFINLRTRGQAVMYSYHAINNYGSNWLLKDMKVDRSDEAIMVYLQGSYTDLGPVRFEITVEWNGSIGIRYYIDDVPREVIRELGVLFEIEEDFDSLQWTRDPYWSYYPADHLSAPAGKTALFSSRPKHYRTPPDKPWNLDTKSFYYEGTANEADHELTRMARATKEDVSNYTLTSIYHSIILSVQGMESTSCRLGWNGTAFTLYVSNVTDYVDLSWGNFQRNMEWEGEFSGQVMLSIH